MRMLCVLVLVASTVGPAHAQLQKRSPTGPAPNRLVKMTTLEVKLTVGPDKITWGTLWRDNAPQPLNFRWYTGYPHVGSAVWQVSTDQNGKKVIASGEAGKPPATGKMRGFTIDFRPIVGRSKQRPLHYYVRVLTYRIEPDVRAQQNRTVGKPSSQIAKRAGTSRIVSKQQAGPPSQPVHVSIIASGPVTKFTNVPESIYTQDRDKDGFPDVLEHRLADQFKPYFVFDSDEKARRSNEPVVLFQVRPEGCIGPRCTKPYRLWIRYAALFASDGGYGPSSDCADTHQGDHLLVDIRITSKPGTSWSGLSNGLSWRLEHIKNWKFEWPQRKELPAPVRWYRDGHWNFGHRHPVIYLSAHKHHQYFDTSRDEKDSIYSDFGCNDDVNGKGARVFANLISPLADKRPNNVGEPEETAHNSTYFISNLTVFGYPGEDVWGKKPFRGGHGGNEEGTLLKSLWMDHPFQR